MRALSWMWGALAIALVTAGCTFQRSGTGGDPIDASPIGAIDAAAIPDARIEPVADAFIPREECSDPDLRLCLRFGADLVGGNALDGSGNGNAAEVVGVEATGRLDGDDAVAADGDTIHIEADGDFNLPAPLTYAAWARLTSGVDLTEDRWRVLDNNDQYSMGFFGDAEGINARKAYCSIDGQALALGNLPLDIGWHHLACVVLGTKVSLFVDGVEQVDSGTFEVLNQTGQGGTCIACNCIPGGPAAPELENADRLVGAVDEVKIWARDLTAPEVCTETGLASCL